MSDPLDIADVVDAPVAQNVRAPDAAQRGAARPPRPDAAIRLSGPETEEAVMSLLRETKKRFSFASRAQLARIIGNEIHVERVYDLAAPNLDLGEDAISDVIGPGVMYLRPADRRLLGLAALTAGGAYGIERVLRGGRTTYAGVSVITRGLPQYPNGFLAYSTSVLQLPEVVVRGRVPRDTQALAQSIANTMDYVGGANRAILAGAVLRLLDARRASRQHDPPGFESITFDELMDTMERLRRMGRLGAFLNLIAIDEFRDFLRSKEIDWGFIYENWQANIGDSGLFFAGFMIGAAQNVLDVAILLGTLAGAALSTIIDHPYLKELADDTRRLVEAIRAFFAHPITNTIAGVRAAYKALEEALWNLDFFEAGRMLGNAVVMVLTLPEAVAALPKAVRAALRGAVKLLTLTADAIVALGIKLTDLLRALAAKAGELVQTAAYSIMFTGDQFIIAGANGVPIGAYPLAMAMQDASKAVGGARTLTKQEDLARLLSDGDIAQWEKNFDETFGAKPGEAEAPPKTAGEAAVAEKPAAATPKRGTKGMLSNIPAELYVQLEQLVIDGFAEVRKKLGKQWLNNREYGTALHSALEDLLTKHFGMAAKLDIAVERRLGDFAHIPASVKKMTIKQFIDANPHFGLDEAALKRVFRDIETQTIERLKPDLVIESDVLRVVWDLTARNNTEHLAKTMFYTAVLDDGKKLTQIAETYWRHFKKGFDPFDFYAVAATPSVLKEQAAKEAAAKAAAEKEAAPPQAAEKGQSADTDVPPAAGTVER